jgi:hypothetical protein
LFSLPYVLVDNKVAGSYFNAKCLNSKTHSKVRLMLEKFQSSVVLVKLTDENGSILHREFIAKKQMNYSKTFDLSRLTDGTYTFIIESGQKKETHDVAIKTKALVPTATRKLTIE